jgi:hypothetical protein
MSRTEVTKETDKRGNESVTFRKSWDKNGVHHSKEVRKVEGGYIITESKYGTPKDSEDGEYIDERKEWVTTENPFEEKEEKEDDDKKMFDFIDKPDF